MTRVDYGRHVKTSFSYFQPARGLVLAHYAPASADFTALLEMGTTNTVINSL